MLCSLKNVILMISTSSVRPMPTLMRTVMSSLAACSVTSHAATIEASTTSWCFWITLSMPGRWHESECMTSLLMIFMTTAKIGIHFWNAVNLVIEFRGITHCLECMN